MTQRTLCCCLLIGVFTGLSAQSSLFGRVTDEQQQPVGYANVVLLSLPDSTFLQGQVSDPDGHFTLKEISPSAHYLIQVSYLGYKTVYRKGDVPDLGTIALEPDAFVLGETVITAQHAVHQLKNGNLVTQVTGSPLANEYSVKDILGKIPGMTNRKGTLEVFGIGAPVVYLNNRKVGSDEELAMLDPKNIKEVELITNPGSRYDAEGKAVLKIRTLTREDGWSGHAELMEQEGRDFRNSESAGLVFQQKGITLSANYGFRDMKLDTRQAFDTDLEEDAARWNYKEHVTSVQHVGMHNYQSSLDYSLTERHSVGARYNGTSTTWRSYPEDRNSVRREEQLFTELVSSGQQKNSGQTHHGNFFYSGQAGEHVKFEVNGDYLSKRSDQDQCVSEVSDADHRDVSIHTRTRSHLYAGRADLSYALGRSGVLSVGGEWSRVEVDGSVDNPDGAISGSRFSNLEKKQAAYLMYESSWKSVSLNAGIRYEAVRSDMNDLQDAAESLSKTYHDWFPNLSLSVSSGKLQSAFSYAVRTTRPAFDILNGKTFYSNRYLLQTGNPQIKPQLSHNLQLSLRYDLFHVRLGYQYMEDFIGSVLRSEGNAVVFSWKNYRKAQMLFAHASASKRWGPWNATLSAGLSAPFITLEYKGEDYKNNTPSVYLQQNNYLSLPADWGVTVDYAYSNGGSKDIWKFKPTHSLNVGVRKSLLHQRLDVSLKAENLFHRLKYRYESSIGNIRFSQFEDRDDSTCTLHIIYRYRNLKSKYRGKGAASDEQRRL